MIHGSRRPWAQLFLIALFLALTRPGASCAPFIFQRDTFAFKNATVLKYKNGLPTLQRQLAADPTNQYTRR